MLVCNYCGRNLKNKYEVCPGCGSNSFRNISIAEAYEINKPPEDGYKIKVESYEKSIKTSKIMKKACIASIILLILFDLPFVLGGIMSMRDDAMFGMSFIAISVGGSSFLYAIAIALLIYSSKMKKEALNNIGRVKKLAKTGLLIKRLPYELVPTGTIINGTPIYCIEIQYESKSGKTITLKSEPKYSNILGDEDGTADLLIDPDDFSNYYIDFEIY